MASVKVAISLPEPLFEQLEEAAAQTNVPRSQLIAEAIGAYLRQRRITLLREQINAAYTDGLDAEDRATLEAFARMHRRTLPPGDW